VNQARNQEEQVAGLLIRQLLVLPVDRNSANVHNKLLDIILQRNKEEKHRVPKETRKSMLHKKKATREKIM
jgi:hypothetical protein